MGVLASYSRKRSTIPTMFYSSHLVEQFGTEKREQTRAIDNLFVNVRGARAAGLMADTAHHTQSLRRVLRRFGLLR